VPTIESRALPRTRRLAFAGLRLWNCFCFSWSGSWFATGRTNARSPPAPGQPPDRKKGRKDCPRSPLERVEG